ncbi:MAG: phosphoglycerate dehydrogenase [Clostridiaceae bacterium]|nr:phosphoglycerate dehydrogenase [Clostridiaceae bacterium]
MFQYTCLNPIAQIGLDGFTDAYQKTEDVNAADAVLVRSAAMHDMELSDSLCAVARAGAGVNNIPLDKCAEKGIVVFNTPGANANGVKELVVAGMLLAARDIAGGIDWVRENASDENISKSMEKAKKNFAGTELKGKKLGIIGLGAIGVLVANVARHFGMDIYGVDPFLSVKNALSLSRDVTVLKSYDELYQICDYITVHVPYIPDTKGMLNKAAFDQMKDGVVILNFARDLLVNDDDMKAALDSGKVAKYVTDFPNPAVLKMKNVIAIPHLGASTAESEDNCAVMAVSELREYLENGNIINSVNYPNCDAGECSTQGRITVAHKNMPKMLTQFTNVFSELGINIDHMTNKSRGDYSYCVFDIDAASSQEIADKLSGIDGVLKVRIIR